MREGHADQGHRKFWPLMKQMTWKERIGHIWYYYARYILLALVCLYIIGDVLYDMNKPQPVAILRGTAVNVYINPATERILKEEAFEAMGGEDREMQTITLLPTEITPADLHAISTVHTKMLSGTYDYALMDQTGLEMLLTMQALPDLNLLLPAEEVAKWEGRFISVQTEDGVCPVAIDITGTPLAAGCSYNGDRIFLGFPVTIDTAHVVVPFYNYLMGRGLLEIP